jgi:endonuclease-3
VLITKGKRESTAEKVERCKVIVTKLRELYPNANCSLDHKTPLQLIIATILSAQCTDARVNLTTPALFKKYKTAKEFAEADLKDLENMVKSTGFYKNKANSIKRCAQAIVAKHKGEVPRTLEELTELTGVGRKTANVVLGVAFGVPGMVVDTHVTRLTNRLGLAKGDNAVRLEFQLMDIVAKEDWIDFSHLLIYHGREICIARTPLCTQCVLLNMCPQLI